MLTIYDPTQDDSLGAVRGGGRVLRILRENLEKEARFISNLDHVAEDETLLIPVWKPFEKTLLKNRLAQRQILLVFDAIPLKFPQHFPIGLKGRWRLYNNLRSLNNFDAFITISEHAKEDLVEYLQLDPNDINVVYTTTSKLFFKPKEIPKKAEITENFDLPDTYCLYVGDTNWNKNLVNLARAVMKADVPMVCVGNTFDIINELREKDLAEQQEFLGLSDLLNHPEQREFKEFVKLTLHDDRFVFPGYVDDHALIAIYRFAQCNVLVSRDEGFGLSYLEASTQKTPSVLADNDIFNEIAGDESKNAALFADPKNPDAIADTISTLFSMSQRSKEYKKLVENAYKRCIKRYSPAQFKKGMLNAA